MSRQGRHWHKYSRMPYKCARRFVVGDLFDSDYIPQHQTLIHFFTDRIPNPN